jgi:hypothetical protein
MGGTALAAVAVHSVSAFSAARHSAPEAGPRADCAAAAGVSEEEQWGCQKSITHIWPLGGTGDRTKMTLWLQCLIPR